MWEKPSFGVTGLTKKKNQGIQIPDNAWSSVERWNSDLLGGYVDFRSHEDKRDDILENERRYSQNATEIDEAIDDLTQRGPSQHAWDQVVPGAAEQAQAQARVEEMRHIEQKDLDANASLFQQQ